MSDFYVDTARHLADDRDYEQARTYAQIGIAISLNRIVAALEKTPVTEEPTPEPVEDTQIGICARCGWREDHLAHSIDYGSHTFEPSSFKNIKEWRGGE